MPSDLPRGARSLLAILLALCLFPTAGHADVASLQAAIDSATEGVRRHAMVGILVRSLTRGDTLYERDAGHLFNPASNEKLLTSAVALARLGPDYRFSTRVLTLGEPGRDGVLHGDLVLQGTGDPLLSTQDLVDLARAVAGTGLRRVTGSLRADDSRFDAQRLGPGWEADDEPFDYAAQISALSLNRNTVRVRVQPGLRPGWPARVSIEPATDYVRIVNRCVTGPRDAAMAVVLDRARARNEITVRGRVPAGSDGFTDGVSVENPALYAATVFRDTLKRAGVTVSGPAVWRRAPPTARLLMAYESLPLAEVLPAMNKPSDNMIAETLLKAAGAERTGTGRTAAGAAELIDFLRDAGLATDPTLVSDGSGLSRHNLVSPATLCGLLERMSRHPDAAIFRHSLPVAGVDGTLRRRMTGTPAERRIEAKTGTLSHVSTLSGYATTPDGETLVFSVMTNNHPGPARTLKEMEDSICLALVIFLR